jgi:hypothetical protein
MFQLNIFCVNLNGKEQFVYIHTLYRVNDSCLVLIVARTINLSSMYTHFKKKQNTDVYCHIFLRVILINISVVPLCFPLFSE